MTMHTRAATDDIYDIFNAPLKPAGHEAEEESGEDDDYETDGDYTTDGESTGTTRHVDASEHGDDETSDVKSVSEWSDFSARKHIPNLDGESVGDAHDETQASNLIDTDYQNDEREPTGPLGDALPHQEGELHTPEDEEEPPRTRTIFIPLPPEDYEPPTRPYRDPVEVANNRLPFMTPITERTESSVEVEDVDLPDHYKTPSRRDDVSLTIDEESDLEPLSSPLREIVNEERRTPKMPVPRPTKSDMPLGKARPIPPKGPIIKDMQCNPVDEAIRNEILANVQPPLSSYTGFYDRRDEKYERGGEIRRYAKAQLKAAKAGAERTGPIPTPVEIELADTTTTYTVRRELGAGAFAPVYLVENSAPDADVENDENAVAVMGKGAFAVSHRSELEALKMEAPPTPWEFHMMRLAHARLGPQHRAAQSLVYAHEMHLYQDEAFLFMPYHPHGTLLDVVNVFRAEPSGVMDEQLAMFFTIELLRTIEALHARNLLHGDLKPDNCLLRLDAISGDEPLSSQWRADGRGGWESRGVILIDFGRAIDMRSFAPGVEFVADWKTTAQDCAEMREGRPWTWQIDYHALAGTLHCLLFGRYIETVRCDQGGGLGRGGRRYRVRESLKRYWQADLWAECFDLLLNPAAHVQEEDGGSMPVLRSMKHVRERMEVWLEANCERGVGLKSMMGKLEAAARSRR